MNSREFIQKLIEIAREVFILQCGDATLARKVSNQVAIRLLDTFRGESVYLPKGTIHEKSKRHQEIFDKYCSGASYDELAHQYSLSEPAVRQVLRKMLKAQKSQPLSREGKQSIDDEE